MEMGGVSDPAVTGRNRRLPSRVIKEARQFPPSLPTPPLHQSILPFRDATWDRAWAYVAVFRRVPGKQEGKKGPAGPTERPRLSKTECSIEVQPVYRATPDS